MDELLINDQSNKEIVSKLDDLIPKLMKDQDIVGLSYTIIKNASFVHSNSFGLSIDETKEKLKIDSILDTGSLTKPIFAYECFYYVLKMV